MISNVKVKLFVRPQKTLLTRLVKGLTVVHVFRVRCTGKTLKRHSQQSNKKTLLDTFENQRTLAKNLKQHSVKRKPFPKHELSPFNFTLYVRPNYSCLHRNSPQNLVSLPFAKISSLRNKCFEIITKGN